MSTIQYGTRGPILAERAAHDALSRWDSARGTGRQVRWAREAAGIPRQELAEYAGMSERTLARIENGERTLLGRERAVVARGLGVGLGFLAPRPRFITDAGGVTTVRANGNGKAVA